MSATPPSVSPEIVIRDCDGLEELEACVQLQKEVWGFNDIDIVPARVFLVASKIGGQVIGAFRGDEIIGYALSIPGNRNGHVYLHSHMLAVKESCRNLGSDGSSNSPQRDDALEKGIELIEWTFDPLEIKNAYLNIVKLGAVARRYNINQYGSFSSPLQGGLPTRPPGCGMVAAIGSGSRRFWRIRIHDHLLRKRPSQFRLKSMPGKRSDGSSKGSRITNS